MLIAFEGPDNVGKSTSASALTSFDSHIYNATKFNYGRAQQQLGGDRSLTQTFDRVDWFTHMVYRLAYPHRDWNDDRPRTVFAMPDTHFVLKMHNPATVALIEDLGDGIEKGKLAAANEMYFYQFDFLMALNRMKDYQLYRTMSIIEVTSDPSRGIFRQELVAHDSAEAGFTRSVASILGRAVTGDRELLDFLHEQDRRVAA